MPTHSAMKMILLWIYVAAFLGVTVASIHDTAERGMPVLYRRLEVILSALAAAGLVGYASGVHHPAVQYAWRLVAPLLTAAFIASGAWELWAQHSADPRRTTIYDRRSPLVLSFGIASTLAFMLPALWFNFRFAFGR